MNELYESDPEAAIEACKKEGGSALGRLCRSVQSPYPQLLSSCIRYRHSDATEIDAALTGAIYIAKKARANEQDYEELLYKLDVSRSVEIKCVLLFTVFWESDRAGVQTCLTSFTNNWTNPHRAFSALRVLLEIALAEGCALFTEEYAQRTITVCMHAHRGLCRAGLRMLLAACGDAKCRGRIALHLNLIEEAARSALGDIAIMATAVLVKIKASRKQEVSHELVQNLKRCIIDETDTIGYALEALAYATLLPSVKRDVGSDVPCLQRILALLIHEDVFPVLSILANLTAFPSNDPDVEKLKRMAEGTRDTGESLEEISARCQILLAKGAVSSMVGAQNMLSAAAEKVVAGIMLSLCKESTTRGQIVRQGGARLLLRLDNARFTAGFALARILISLNPAVVMKGNDIRSAIHLVHELLLCEDTLARFESLLALTNLASINDEAANDIARLGLQQVHEDMLDKNPLLQRAATELICNLAASPICAAMFLDPASTQRLQILFALTDAPDTATRRAATGAVAILSEYPPPANHALIQQEKGIDMLGRALEDDSDCALRALVCLGNLVRTQHPLLARKLQYANIRARVQQCLENKAIREPAMQLLPLLE